MRLVHPSARELLPLAAPTALARAALPAAIFSVLLAACGSDPSGPRETGTAAQNPASMQPSGMQAPGAPPSDPQPQAPQPETSPSSPTNELPPDMVPLQPEPPASAGAGSGETGAGPSDGEPGEPPPMAPPEMEAEPPLPEEPAAFAPCPTDGNPCVILPVGDSITFGLGAMSPVPNQGGYRVELFRRALADGHAITFTGRVANGPNTVDGQPFPRGHEGYSGATINDGGNQLANSGTRSSGRQLMASAQLGSETSHEMSHQRSR